jgi:hypothetical protein
VQLAWSRGPVARSARTRLASSRRSEPIALRLIARVKLRCRIASRSDRLVFMMPNPTWAQAYWPCARVRVSSRKVASANVRGAHDGFRRGGSRFSPRRSAEARHRARRWSGTPHRPSFGSRKNRWLEQATVPSAVARPEEISPSGGLSRDSRRSTSRSKPRSRRCASSLGQRSDRAQQRSLLAIRGADREPRPARVRISRDRAMHVAQLAGARAMPAGVWTAAGDDRAR